MNVVDALRDPALFGSLPVFEDLGSWRPWIAFLRAFHGLPMDEGEIDLFRRHTGRQRPAEGGYAEAVVVTGRQSGKTQTAALVGVFEAAHALVADETGVLVPLVAQDLRGAQRALYGYVQQAIDSSPLLRAEKTRETSTEIELGGRVTIGVYPCRPAAVRGIRASTAIVDELAHFTSTDGRPTDVEMIRALRPTLATTGGRLLILSSPHAQLGALWDLHRRHHGRDGSSTLVWQASAPEMNPTLPADYLERMKHEDPEAFLSEVAGEFRQGISTFIDQAVLDAVIDQGIRERSPLTQQTYVGFVDAASGSGKDAFAVGIAHRDGDRGVLDVVRAWHPPFNPSGAIAEAADLLRRYNISTVQGDRYAPGFVAEGFRQHGVRYEPAPRSTSETYLELLPLVNSGAVAILDDPLLLKQLRGLERHAQRSGRDRVDHRPGAHDDVAVAAAGALVATAKPTKKYGTWRQRTGRRIVGETVELHPVLGRVVRPIYAPDEDDRRQRVPPGSAALIAASLRSRGLPVLSMQEITGQARTFGIETLNRRK